MYAKYVTTANPNQAQVISDIILLLTSTPNGLADLSASCDKANSTLLTMVAPGWTLVDSAAPSSGFVISAPDAAGLTTKYARLYALSGTTIDLLGNETWNAATHVGTNATVGANTNLAFTVNKVNTYWIFATPRSIFIGSITSAGNPGGALCHVEFSRDIGYLQGSTYPCFVIGDLTSLSPFATTAAHWMSSPRIKSQVGAGDITGTSALLCTGTITPKYLSASTVTSSPITPLRDAQENQYNEIRPIWLVNQLGQGYGAIHGKLYDIQETNRNIGNTFDTFSDGVNNYMAFVTSYATFALKMA